MRNLFTTSRSAAALLLAVLASCSRQPAAGPAPARAPSMESVPEFHTGQSVVTAMHDRYAGRWYRTLTFVQKTTQYRADGSPNVQTWYEALRLPGRLRIDFDPVSAGNGILFARDSQYQVANGRLTRASAGVNDLLLLGFDVYGNAPERTVALLQREGFDLTRVHADTFQGRPMIVVGAREGDLRRKQFWIDADRMLFVRLLEQTPRDSTKMQDIRFLDYVERGGGWVAPRVEIHTDGRLVFSEDYSDIRANVPLDDALFDARTWKSARHWTAAP